MSSCGSVPAGSSPRRMARSAIGAASLCRSAKRSRLIAASWSELGAPENSAREAIVPGDPVQASFETGNIQHLMFGMAGIAGNAFGFTAPPSPAQQAAACRPFHRGALLQQHGNAPMLVLNGTDDVHLFRPTLWSSRIVLASRSSSSRGPGTARPSSCPRSPPR